MSWKMSGVKVTAVFFSCFVFCLVSLNAKSADEYALYFTRHADKVESSGRDPGLTATGSSRAEMLADFLADKQLAAIYSSSYKRTQQTAQPAASRLDIPITPYHPAKLSDVASLIMMKKENALIVGHSNTTPDMVHLVGGEAKEIAEHEYGDLFVVTVSDGSRRTVHLMIQPAME